MTNFSTKALSLLLSLALIISVFTMVGTISASAEDLVKYFTADEITFENSVNNTLSSSSKDIDDGLILVSGVNKFGTDKGFVFKLTGASTMYLKSISFTLSANTAQNVSVAFGKYAKVQNVNNLSDAVKKTGQKIDSVDTVFTFSLDKPEYYGYDTFYVTITYQSATKAETVTLKSVSATYTDAVINIYKFKTSVNAGPTAMSFADDYWAMGQWVSGNGRWDSSTNRISITKKIPVKEGAIYTFTFNKSAVTPSFAQVLTRVYKSGIGNIADGGDLIASGNQNTMQTNFISPSSSMEIASGSTGSSTTNIDSSGTKIKIKEGCGGAYMLISLFSSGWASTHCTAALAAQAADGYSLRITETLTNSTNTLMSVDGSNVTAPGACLVNPGETFIGWRNDKTGKLYPAGSVLTNEDFTDKTFTAVSAKVETQEGAGVRWSNTDVKRGLKFTTYISGNVNAAELKNYISPALVKTVISGNSKTVDVMNSSTNDGNSEFAEESNDTTLVFHGSVTEYQSDTSMLTVDFTAQGVATVTYADGTTMELASSTTTTRNMKYVAQAAYDALKDETTELATSKCALLKDVYGVQ